MEINRIEADRHLIGVGRELESLDGKAKATLPVHVTEDGLRFYKRDPEGEWQRLHDAEQDTLTVGTLQAVVDYLNQNPDGLELDKLLVHVCDVTTVRVMSVPFGGWKQRTTYMRADAVIPAHRFGSWTADFDITADMDLSRRVRPLSPVLLCPLGRSRCAHQDQRQPRGHLRSPRTGRRRVAGSVHPAGRGTQGRSSRTVPGGRLPVQHLRGSRAARAQGRVQAPV